MAKQFAGLGATIIDTVADLPSASASLEGLMYYQKDTNELKICDGSRWISMLDTDVPPGMVLLQPTSVSGCTNTNGNITFSASTNMTINGVFSAAFNTYKIEHWLYTGSSSISNGIFKLTAGGTPSSVTYYSRMWYYTNSGGGFLTAAANNAASTDWSFYGGNLGGSGTITLANPYVPTNTTATFNQSMWSTADNVTTNGSFFHYQATQYDGFNLSSATAMTGNLKIYGLRDSI